MAAPKPFMVGDTNHWELDSSKDGVTWDLSAAAVTLKFKKPSGTIVTKAATGTATGAYYDSDTALLDTAGDWYFSWHVAAAGIVQSQDPVKFTVESL